MGRGVDLDFDLLAPQFPRLSPRTSPPPRPNVVKISHDPFQMRTIIIVQIKNNWRLQSGLETLERQIDRQTDAAFRGTDFGTAISKVYWITTIGPHWRYGVKEDDGQGLRPLIAWHETTHDRASYDDFQRLTSLIAELQT
ncbi:hypothetical protein EDB89DRAFT_2066850 [Lactarius sanguifluus]|nr:hypothetical protein EDB89DRAFT_2066850 [Lactarius sanguifluus]